MNHSVKKKKALLFGLDAKLNFSIMNYIISYYTFRYSRHFPLFTNIMPSEKWAKRWFFVFSFVRASVTHNSHTVHFLKCTIH